MVKSLSLNLKYFYLLKKCIKFWLEKMYGSREKNVRIKELRPFLTRKLYTSFF